MIIGMQMRCHIGSDMRSIKEMIRRQQKSRPEIRRLLKMIVEKRGELFDHLSDQVMIRRVGNLQLDYITDIRLPGSYVHHAVNIRRLL